MSAPIHLEHWIAAARRRQQANDALLSAPMALAIAALAWRIGGWMTGLAVLIAGVSLALLVIRHRSRRFDRRWLTRRLDATRTDMEDSAALLFAERHQLGPIQQLQQDRILVRLDAGAPDALAGDWRTKPIAAAWAAGIFMAALALVWPASGRRPVVLSPSAENISAPPGVSRLIAQNMRIIPPAYTGLPIRDEAKLDARVPAGSRIEWTLRFVPQASDPRLAIVSGSPIALHRQDGEWVATRAAGASFLYRVDTGDARAPVSPLHRIDVTPDAPPQVRVVSPSASLTLVRAGQRSWSPSFEATDDYGVAATARLRVTLAIGEGENVTFSEREIAIAGSGPTRQRRFAPMLDFSRLGFSAGGDMVVQLIVRDNRSPGPQEMRGPSILLRWPAPKAPESGGLQGMVNTTLPAYFRSQRQIIIDAEALLKQKRALNAERYLSKSNAIGNDQEILRGRYSQFLGGEQEGQPELPTADDHHDGDGHDHGTGLPQPAQQGFGAPEDVLAEFGHPHDDAAATSLDPETRGILKNAVDEMWQSELQLKQGRPDLALPFAYRALRFIKQVQQATRIFLSRVGPELPPIDPTRRMTGKREGLGSRELPVAPIEGTDGVVAATWRALGEGGGAIRGPIDLGGLERWISANRDRLADPLSLAAAIDAVRSEPGCQKCRARLRGQLWLAMERPPAGNAPRPRPDAAGQRYLRLLGGGAP